MASVVSGYEYDIFISYRHNDNRSGWVTEFVNALREELSATIKEPLSIYFDQNPHDGLLETHDVGDSLKEKLKSLILIPIVSQTYCDPKSFAWQHEFLVFLHQAVVDTNGLKVRLPNGNTASRVLPIRIHELDASDKKIIEAELGPLRAIDFTYQSAGVNRPLRPKDDETIKANYQNVYRDQVNKTANAIKEIIHGIQGKFTPENEKGHKGEVLPSFFDSGKKGDAKRNFKFKYHWFSKVSLLLFGFIVASASLIAVLLFCFSQASLETQTYKSNIPSPDKSHFAAEELRNFIALSPNGRIVAFVATDSAGKSSLWVRHLNATNAQFLSGTEGATLPFWSPDSRFIGFFAKGKLMKIEPSGGVPQTLSDAPNGRGGTWGKEGAIIFSGNPGTPLSIISSSGGKVISVTKFDTGRKEVDHRWPFFLPDGKHFLFLSRLSGGSVNEGDGIFLASTDTTVKAQLVVKASSNVVFANGHLLFANRNTLMAQPFDEASLQTTGDAFPVLAEPINFVGFTSSAFFSASQNGILIYQKGESQSSAIKLTWHDRSGKQSGSVGSSDVFYGLRLAPNGKRVVASYPDNSTGNIDSWVCDIERSLWTRFTFHAANDLFPIWSPDGRMIVFTANPNKNLDLYIRGANGETSEKSLLISSQDKYPSDWSRDGKFLAFYADEGGNKYDIWVMPMDQGVGSKPFVFLKTAFNESRATFSPDGRWIAYQSDESGQSEIYIRPFPGPGGNWQISHAGGSRPRWRGDGKELFFLSADLKMMAAEVRLGGSSIEVVSVKPLFQIGNFVSGTRDLYDVTTDGQQFLIETFQRHEVFTPLTLVVNWPGEIKRN